MPSQTVLPSTGPYFVAAMRLIPAGGLLVAFAAATGRKQPAGAMAWLAVAAFALVDGAMFQVSGSASPQLMKLPG